MTRTPPSYRRTALTVWGVALSVYLLAVFNRSSLAVAGLVAAERFDITAAQLATFTMLQLLVYAAMQVPVGLMVDRFGSRSVLLTAATTMTLGQTLFALAQSYPVALGARVLVGMGDAMTFICVLRLVAMWFPVRRIPFATQMTGTLGQAGALLSAIPMTIALSSLGWTRAYLLAAIVGVVLVVVALVVLRDSPEQRTLRGEPMFFAAVRESLAASWAHPGTRLGFWIHFTTQFSGTAMALLWGFPFLVRGEGRSEAEAGVLLTLMIVAIIAAGPFLGLFVGRHPWHRSTLALWVVASIVGVWTLVLAWPGPAPLPLLVLLVVVAAVGGPTSMIGFDLGRTSNPAARLASATGIINQGGFSASLVLVVAIGLVLDWHNPGAAGDYGPDDFRWAMSVQYVLWALGLLQIWRWRRRTRVVIDREELEAGIVPES